MSRPAAVDPRIMSESWGTSGHVYWIELVPGLAFKGSALHNIAAFSKAQAHAKMHRVVPCYCATCKILSRPAAQRTSMEGNSEKQI